MNIIKAGEFLILREIQERSKFYLFTNWCTSEWS